MKKVYGQRGRAKWRDFPIENHCPICHVASTCLNFCRSELSLFQTLLGEQYCGRTEHILEGARRQLTVFRTQYGIALVIQLL